MNDNVFVLTRQNSIANHFLSELRDEAIQQDRMRFRTNLERLGEILAYEISKVLPYGERTVTTPLGKAAAPMLSENPVLVTILRAGLPFHQGFLRFFDRCDNGFIGAYRTEGKHAVTINLDYVSLPAVAGKVVILIDPMLATGGSSLDAIKILTSQGIPAHLHIVSVVAAPEGLRLLNEELKIPYSLWTCAIDEKLNSSFYIVPGLGDAGDLSFGVKM